MQHSALSRDYPGNRLARRVEILIRAGDGRSGPQWQGVCLGGRPEVAAISCASVVQVGR